LEGFLSVFHRTRHVATLDDSQRSRTRRPAERGGRFPRH